jgi:hypothetical protein
MLWLLIQLIPCIMWHVSSLPGHDASKLQVTLAFPQKKSFPFRFQDHVPWCSCFQWKWRDILGHVIFKFSLLRRSNIVSPFPVFCDHRMEYHIFKPHRWNTANFYLLSALIMVSWRSLNLKRWFDRGSAPPIDPELGAIDQCLLSSSSSSQVNSTL